MTSSPFEGTVNLAAVPIADLVAWTHGESPCRLFLPPIQRSAVWSNRQIVNYWDSLLRGYPAGLMLVHRSRQAPAGVFSRARNAEGQTCEVRPGDVHLFDGQQRLTAILLGHQAGQLACDLRLWVDLGVDPATHPDLLYQLRISSTGQPFGYQPSEPNQKISLGERREKSEVWNRLGRLPEAFAHVKGEDIIRARSAVPLAEIITLLTKQGRAAVVEKLRNQIHPISHERIDAFLESLKTALAASVTFQLIPPRVVEEEKEYIRYFGRLGQGGTPLSSDELTYSIIKHQYPEVHDRMGEIMKGDAGRMTGEVNLVLAALRVAKVLSPWSGAHEWEIIARPTPDFVSRLQQLPAVKATFRTYIPPNESGRLKTLLELIRERLVYSPGNLSGLPVMLLARLPHQLVDALLLLVTRENQAHAIPAKPDLLPAFVLYWFLFVADNDKAANLVFKRYREMGEEDDRLALPRLIHDFQKADIARPIPTREELAQVRTAIESGDYTLRAWTERFASLDADPERKTGESLRVLSTHNGIIKCALLWLQRDYLANRFPRFDPTSNRDEDLPVDLDHLIPHSKFGFHWASRDGHLDIEVQKENFRWHRGLVGNSLGNYRWLDASENRGRGAGGIETLVDVCDFLTDPAPWNELIKTCPWRIMNVATFQKLIDLRTMAIYERILVEGGLNHLLGRDDGRQI